MRRYGIISTDAGHRYRERHTHHKELGQGYKRKMAKSKNRPEKFTINTLTAYGVRSTVSENEGRQEDHIHVRR